MTVSEFSNGFDALVNSYRRFKSFDGQEPYDTIDFNEFEKSFYLTKAQEELVKALYSGEALEGESYEETERLRRYLSELNEEAIISPAQEYDFTGISSDSQFFTLPEGVWFITYEAVEVSSDDCWNGKTVEVIPVRQDWYHRQNGNPFRGPSMRRALRLDTKGEMVEIVYPATIAHYYMRYLKKPQPIVVVNLPNGITVGEKREKTECALHPALHQKILDNAVLLALRSRGIVPERRRESEDRDNR